MGRLRILGEGFVEVAARGAVVHGGEALELSRQPSGQRGWRGLEAGVAGGRRR